MDLALNHYFTLVDQSFPQKQELLEQGFKLFGPRNHTGQGTSAEFVLYPKNYIEYIWIDDLEASQNNLLKLYRRNQGGACKYGLCFVGALSEKHKRDYLLYSPPYSPNSKILVFKDSIDGLSMPLVFIDVSSNNPKDFEPQNNKKVPFESLNPQHQFFIPEELRDLKMPEYLKRMLV